MANGMLDALRNGQQCDEDGVMWPFSQPKCPTCKGALVPNSGAIGHAAYRCPSCIRAARLEKTLQEIDDAIAYNRATVDFYKQH